MAAEIFGIYKATAELIEGSGGIFEVEVDGRIIFDKAQTDRFPFVGEMSKLLEGQ